MARKHSKPGSFYVERTAREFALYVCGNGHTNYSIDPGNIPRFVIAFDGIQPDADGTGAVLNGPNGKDSFKNEFRVTRTNVVDFATLRRMSASARSGH
jgi:hypothetical protein